MVALKDHCDSRNEEVIETVIWTPALSWKPR